MESDNEQVFHGKRMELLGGLADQGTEKGMGDDRIICIPRFSQYQPAYEDDRYMYPVLLMLPGHLRILFNALQEALSSLPSTTEYIEKLRAVESFLSNKQLRQAFQWRCIGNPGVRAQFDNYSTVHIDWKWNFLEKALTKLVPLISVMEKHFDIQKLSGAATAGEQLKDVCLTSVDVTLTSDPCFGTRSELFRSMGFIVNKYASKLETCFCHEDISGKRTPHKRRRDEFTRKTGNARCVWKGRMRAVVGRERPGGDVQGADRLFQRRASCHA